MGETMTSREAFEEYERTHYTQGLEMWGDNYKNTHVRCRWEGWQAATERAALIADADHYGEWLAAAIRGEA